MTRAPFRFFPAPVLLLALAACDGKGGDTDATAADTTTTGSESTTPLSTTTDTTTTDTTTKTTTDTTTTATVPPNTVPTPSTTDTADTADTGAPPPPIGFGSVVLAHRAPSLAWSREHTAVRALFGDTLQGFLNAAECAPVVDGPCLSALPAAPDTWVDAPGLFDPGASVLLEAGAEVALDAYVAPRLDLVGFGVHYESAAIVAPPFQASTDLALTIPGDTFPAYAGVADVRTPSMIGPVTPAPLALHDWFPGDVQAFTWTPGGDGDVYLVAMGGSVSRLYQLADDGLFELPVDDLGLADGDAVTFVLGRWVFDEVDVGGNPVALLAKSDAWILGTFTAPIDAGVLPDQDTCAVAIAAPELLAGSWVGSLGGYADNLDPSCVSATGPDAVHRVVLDPGERVSVTYELVGEDGVVYVLDACGAAGACLAQQDLVGTVAEQLTYTNTGPATVDVYLGLDEYTGSLTGSGFYTLDVAFDFPVLVQPGETCADAVAALPLEPGVYVGDLTDASPNLTPLDSQCGSVYALDGADELFRVTVPPGELLRVHTEGAMHYLMEDCASAGSCLNSSVNGGQYDPPQETLYLNTDAVPHDLFLGVDAQAGNEAQYELDLQLEPVLVANGSDDCAGAAAAPPLGEGTYWTTVGDDTATMDPAGAPGCGAVFAGGEEELHRITVPDGEVLHVELPNDISAYLMEDCADLGTCFDGEMLGASLTHGNLGGADEDIFLVIDRGDVQPNRVSELQVWFDSLIPASDADDCATALGLAPVTTGVWGGDTTGYANNLNPGAAGCADLALPGPDAMLPVHLEPWELLTIDDLGFEEAVYAVRDCLSATTCVAASPPEDLLTSEQGLIHLAGAVAEDLFVIVDNTDPAGGEYAIDLDIRPTDATLLPDSCDDVAGFAPLTTGSWAFRGDLVDYAEDVDPMDPACAPHFFSGRDAVLPVLLQPGESFDVLYSGLGNVDEGMYVLETCDDLAACTNGDNDFNSDVDSLRMTYTNATDLEKEVYLVLDSNFGVGDFAVRIDVR